MIDQPKDKPHPWLAAVLTVFIVPTVVLWMVVCATLLLVFWPILPVLVYLHLLQTRKAD